jgi:hypothetical protein
METDVEFVYIYIYYISDIMFIKTLTKTTLNSLVMPRNFFGLFYFFFVIRNFKPFGKSANF